MARRARCRPGRQPAGRLFKEHSAGELSERIYHLNQLSQLICEAGWARAPALFSLAYLAQIAGLSPALTLPAALILLVQLGVAASSMALRTRLIHRQMEAQQKVGGIVFALISGIQKIKLCGSEKRAFANWAALYGEQARAVYASPLFLRIETAVTTAIALAGTALIYLRAAQTGVSPAEFIAFSAAYGLMSGVVLKLAARRALSPSSAHPRIHPAILEAAPETSETHALADRRLGQHRR